MSVIDSGYELIDSVKANVPDCFVARNNKMGSGNGEAKFYIGATNTKDWLGWFENFGIQCFFTKKDLADYLDMASVEYEAPTQPYRNNITQDLPQHRAAVDSLPEDIFFTVFRKVEQDQHRYYIQSRDLIWTLFRKVSLPIMTSVLVQKIMVAGRNYIWFRPYINEIGNTFAENEVINDFVEKEIEKVQTDRTIADTVKIQLTKARVGQGAFRDGIIRKYEGRCIITNVNDERVLIASHIKPWSIGTNAERLSHENGLLLTPTYDKLFDKGFISFRDSGEILLSDYFSENNFRILNLRTGLRFNLRTTDEMRVYLEYHRESVFIK